jgi:hypothetical protein
MTGSSLAGAEKRQRLPWKRRQKSLKSKGVKLNEEKTRIVQVRHGFEFLGFKIKRGSCPLYIYQPTNKSGARTGALYACPRQKSVQHFKDQICKLTRRK